MKTKFVVEADLTDTKIVSLEQDTPEAGDVSVMVGDYCVVTLRPGKGVIFHGSVDADEVGMPIDSEQNDEVLAGDSGEL